MSDVTAGHQVRIRADVLEELVKTEIEYGKFMPDWKSVSSDAVRYVLTASYYDVNGDFVPHHDIGFLNIDRPKQEISVGQVWTYSGDDGEEDDSVHIIYVSKQFIGYVNFHNVEDFISEHEFTSRFEFVGERK